MENTYRGIYHTPVLLNESIKYLVTDPSGIYVDGTVGGGGHSEAIGACLNSHGKLIGLDRDKDAIAHCQRRFLHKKFCIHLIHEAFGKVDHVLRNLHISTIHGFLLDLGISSHLLEIQRRGFSFMVDSPLDMRMDTSSKHNAEYVVNQYNESSLCEIFFKYGEERNARRIAHAIVNARQKKPIKNTGALVEVISRVTSSHSKVKTLSRIFQALRIEINDELNQLKMGLIGIYPYLVSKGRIVVISYHSLEDRIVKRYFRGEEPTFRRENRWEANTKFRFQILTKRVVRPSEEEIKKNPRARSAKLRCAAKL